MSESPPVWRWKEGDLLTVPEALKLLPVPKSTFHGLLADGEIEHVRMPSGGSRRGRILIVRRSLEEFLDRLLLKASPPTSAGVDTDSIIARYGGGRG